MLEDRIPQFAGWMLGGIPAVALVAMSFMRRRWNPVYTFVALAIFVSWIADMIGWFWLRPDWYVASLYPPLQMAMLTPILAGNRDVWDGLLVGVLGLMVIRVGAWVPAEPDVVVLYAVSFIVVLYSWKREDLGRARTVLLWYFGATIPALLVLGPARTLWGETGTWVAVGLYQVPRLIAVAYCCWAIWREQERVQVRTA